MFVLKINLKKLLISLFVPLAVGGVSALLTRGSMEDFARIQKPPLSPPAFLFPLVWTILYVLMGVAAYLVWNTGNTKEVRKALYLYTASLFFNFFWSIIFFNLEMYLLAFVWLVILWVLIILTARNFYEISKAAGYLFIPYIIWVSFAGYLNFAIFLLN